MKTSNSINGEEKNIKNSKKTELFVSPIPRKEQKINTNDDFKDLKEKV